MIIFHNHKSQWAIKEIDLAFGSALDWCSCMLVKLLIYEDHDFMPMCQYIGLNVRIHSLPPTMTPSTLWMD